MIATPASERERGLDPRELASAAVMASVCVGLVALSSLVPQLAALGLATVVPFGVVAERHRVRALIAALAASAFVTALLVGLGSAIGLAVCALVGGLVGVIRRRGMGVGALLVAAAVLAPLAAVVIDAVLLLFASARTLMLQSMRSTARGIARTLEHVSSLRSAAAHFQHACFTVIDHWAVTAAAVMLILVPAALLFSWWLLGRVLERLRWVGAADGATVAASGVRHQAEPAPLPVALRGISVRYGAIEALAGVDLTLGVGEFIAVVGDNGSGKSTLARLLAGAQPSAGTIDRDGHVGLGAPGGTAVISQRPDAQVVGLRVAEDIVWGLPDGHGVDVDELLETVGLAGMATRDTSSLSGGQLQRLAVAAALARRPRLLISDESTAMVDPAGRRELTRLFAELPRRQEMTVLHITHHEDELAFADRVLRLDRGRLVRDDQATGPAGPVAVGNPEPNGAPVPAGAAARPRAIRHVGSAATGGLVLSDVGHDYGHGTVWQQRALEAVTLSVGQGEGVLVTGENGSGKSTLAWILAGLIRPSFGRCLLDGVPTHRRHGAVGLAFQHARLQLQRPTVAEEVADAGGWAPRARQRAGREPLEDRELERRVAEALRAVRLEPELASRSIEQLSGGQQRRLALAVLLARNPRVLVLDEPLAGLDAPARSALVALLAELRERDRITLIVVTHDPETLATVCPRHVRLERGRLVADSGASERAPLQESAA